MGFEEQFLNVNHLIEILFKFGFRLNHSGFLFLGGILLGT
jgi:hypothetical protein